MYIVILTLVFLTALLLIWVVLRNPPPLPEEDWHEWHRRQLESPEWKRARKQQIELDGGHCRLCSSVYRLQVHHSKYLGRIPLWHPLYFKLKLLVTLCCECHTAYTIWRRSRRAA